MAHRLMLCNCGATQSLDRDAIGRATGLDCSQVHTALCTREADRLAAALQSDPGNVIVACEQETEAFAAIAADAGGPEPLTVDIRDRAGWSDESTATTPKMAALLAAARLPRNPVKVRDVTSEGLCLIVGPSEVVLPVADQLAETLSVTCLLSDRPEILTPPVRRWDACIGRLRKATGAFGGFSVTVDAYQRARPEGRGPLDFDPPRDGAVSDCDVLLDLSGNPPLFPAHEKRDGYLRADPRDPLAVQRAAFAASHLVGTFEKTLHIDFQDSLCAHSRAGQIGCTRCLEVCPTGAITSAGDTVAIAADICAGCGACAAVCPSGAASYDDPPTSETFAAIRTLATAYREAGGKSARLLVHDGGHGREMIGLSARLGRGLPAAVIPHELGSLAAFGHAEMLVALATGFVAVDILLSPTSDRDTIAAEAELANTITDALTTGGPRVSLLDPADPDAMSDTLYAAQTEPLPVEPILPLGQRRDATRLAAQALAGRRVPDLVSLPAGAPYGAVLVDTDACTLCLACAGLCPSGALGDNPEQPQLLFREDACLQCGLCANVCPEDAITLEPRLDLTDAALRQRVMKEEEPYACIECGTLFGVKSTVERIVAKLDGQHAMFKNSDNARLIRMCDDCRVRAQYHDSSAPFRSGNRPRVRTTDDYLEERKKN